MEYQDPKKMSKAATEKAFSGDDDKKICEALVSVAFYEEDWKWAQDKCLYFLEDSRPDICALAATCLRHIARIHHQLEKEKVIAALCRRLDDPLIAGQIEDALDDIGIFLK